MLDFTASAAELGKPGGGADLKLGLATAPALYAWDEFPQLGELIERKFSEEGDVEEVRFSSSFPSSPTVTDSLDFASSILLPSARRLHIPLHRTRPPSSSPPFLFLPCSPSLRQNASSSPPPAPPAPTPSPRNTPPSPSPRSVNCPRAPPGTRWRRSRGMC
jgi:hypothetical protein